MIDNDAEAALAAETLPGGSCFGLESAVYLTLGTGIGGALLINGRPWRGHDNAAAELGHFVTHAGGLKCACGMNGCFEMYASAGALTRLAGGVRARTVIDRARDGDADMLAVLDAYAREIAIGLCSLYMIFRPQAIVLGGRHQRGGRNAARGHSEKRFPTPTTSPRRQPAPRCASRAAETTRAWRARRRWRE